MNLHKRRPIVVFAVLVIAVLTCSVTAGYADLFSYVAQPDAAFQWELRSVDERPLGKIYDLHMVSQVWQGIKWEHQIQVYEPQNVEFPDVMALFITGGEAGPQDQMLGLTAANLTGARLAILYHIPNQPLFGDLREDNLISYTWVKYLETGDEDWVLLFPMVKSVLRAMDCLEELAQQRWEVTLRGFMVAGASKRGWTTYLTAIADPQRTIAIAPMVFDILNMGVQTQHQRDFWGDYSEMISEYTEKDLAQMLDRDRGFRLSWMVDPYSYRDRLLMPKFIILGSNDRYWPIDAVNFYWPGLAQPKLLLIAPNCGHGLKDMTRVIGSVGAFFRLIAQEKPLPQMQWQFDESAEGLVLHVTANPQPLESRLWVARSEVRDFREAQWVAEPLLARDNELLGKVSRATGQYTAVYGEVVFDIDGSGLYASTQPRVIHPGPEAED